MILELLVRITPYNNQVIQIMDESIDLYKKEAKVITKLDEVINILVSGKEVEFRVLKIRPTI